MTNLRSLSDLFRAAMKLAVACAFVTAMAVVVSGQTNTFPSSGNVGIGTTTPAATLNIPTGNVLLGAPSTNLNQTTCRLIMRTGLNQNICFESSYNANTASLGVANDANTAYADFQLNANNLLFFGNNSERMRITSTGNIGIGTTSPQTRFDIKQSSDTFVGGLHLRRSSTNDTWALVSGADNSLYMGYANNASGADASSDFTVYPLVLTSAGNVGVGTPSPTFPLEVSKSQAAATYIQVTNSNTSTGNAAAMRMFTSGNNALTLSASGNAGAGGYAAITQEANLPLLFRTNLTEHMRITGGGNVGINTNNPAYKLDVNGEINATGIRINGTPISGGGNSPWLGTGSIYYNDGNVGIGTSNPNQRLSVAGTGAFYNSTPVTPSGVRGLFMGNFSTGSSIWSYNYASGQGDALFISAQDINLSTYVGGNGINRLFVANGGNVGIGTTSPIYSLDVNGGVNGFRAKAATTSSSDAIASFENSNGIQAIVRGNGNVGIGITNPSAKLELAPNSNIKLGNAYFSSGGDYLHLANNEWFNGTAWTATAPGALIQISGQDVNFYRHDAVGAHTQSLNISSSGNVGIGTTSAPSFKLDVQGGQINSSGGLCIAGDCKTAWSQVGGGSSQWSNGANSTINYNTGSVGIGTTTPATAFHVIGDATVSNNIAINGATLKPWQVGKALQGTTGALFLGNSGDTHVTSNAYTTATGTGWKYMTAGTAANFYMYQGSAVFRNAVSGSADADVNWANRMVITPDGNVGIGTTDPANLLTLKGKGHGAGWLGVQRSTNTTVQMLFANAEGTGYTAATGTVSPTWTNVIDNSNSNLMLSTVNSGGTGGKIILDAGNVGIGTTPGALYRLDVQGKINSSELCIGTDCKSSWSQVGGGGGPPSFSSVTAGTNTAALLVSGSLGVSDNGTINATTLGGATFAAPGAIGATAPGTGAFSAVGINTAPSSHKLDVNGNTNVTGNITVSGTGNITATGTITGNIINAKYQDLAEWVPSSEQLSAGTVVVLDTTKSNQVVSATSAYDTRVAGVISAQPGITLGEGGEGKVLVATTGRVRVKVDASRGAIQIGDLLVTSDVSGVAMKSEAVNLSGVQIHRPGTIIGKALEPLAKGSGEILVLLSLQ